MADPATRGKDVPAGVGNALQHRERVADFWDEVVSEFLDGGFPQRPPLDRWLSAYEGAGDGLVDRDALPEAYAGPILGNVRAVVLGLNPGMVFPRWQHRDGILANEIRREGSYRRVYETSPVSREPWLSEVGTVTYYTSRIRLMRQWNDDASFGDANLLTFELYPWHSKRVTGSMRPDPAIIDEMVFDPIGEIGVRHVFAFGAEWFRVLDGLNLEEEVTLGKGGEPYGSSVPSRTVGVYRHSSGFLVVAEKHSGGAGPPSTPETDRLREALDKRGLG